MKLVGPKAGGGRFVEVVKYALRLRFNQELIEAIIHDTVY